MRRISKVLVMAVVILAVITMSLTAKAFSKQDLINYITATQNVNGMEYSLSKDQKDAVVKYLTDYPLSDAEAESIKNDIESAKKMVADTGATNYDQISKEVKVNVLNTLKTAAGKVGLELKVNTNNNTVTIVEKSTGKNLASGYYTPYVPNNNNNNGGSQVGGTTLVYTGASFAVYAIPVLAIVAVATILVVRKRS